MKLWLLGVRGSTPAPGPNFVRYGGHTSCVGVVPNGGREPTLLLDAGTGVRTLTDKLATGSFNGSILLSHLHWDHVEGIPFSRALDRPDTRADLYLPGQGGETPFDLLSKMMSPPHFPITPDGLKGSWTFNETPDEKFKVEGFTVTAAEVEHKGGRTLGYRVEDEGHAIAYIPDHAPTNGMSDEVWALIDNVDVLLHDAQFVENERPIAEDYGHATIEETIRLAEQAHVKTLVLFHHSPVRTDAELDLLGQDIDSDIDVVIAREGMTIPLH
ncbi:MAG TPA: MBL fold metallo-hydrolase [Nocardioidaceae bacterium]|nr:MBL fold metallo-hydrolase [Nocardioidaceae bacterium]